MKIQEVIEFIEKIAPPHSGVQNDENKLLFGDPDIRVNAIGVTWMATTPVIKEAVSKRINLIFVHEKLFSTYQESDWYEDSQEEDKEINRIKKQLLKENNIAVYRAHSNWDVLKEYGVIDSLGPTLGYAKIIGQTKFIKTYEIPKKY